MRMGALERVLIPGCADVWLLRAGFFVPRVQTRRTREVLRLYRTILKEGESWGSRRARRALEFPEEVETERKYIRWEAQRLFKRNKNITDMSIIDAKIFEATTRLELAQHYQNPYPRHSGGMLTGPDYSNLAYMHSYSPLNGGVDATFLTMVGARDFAFALPPV
eukprot:RCo049359